MIQNRLLPFLRQFRRSEDASGTIEFVMWTPFMLGLMLTSVELGLLLTRQVMLDRGMDIAVRSVRIGTMETVDHDTLLAAICDAALIIPDCRNQLRLEMRPVNPRAWTAIPANADCVNREDPASAPVRDFTPGQQNQLMVLRACALFDPIFPTTGIATSIPKVRGGDAYGLVSTTSYVVEPI